MADNRYRITERVAAGGMAEVFKGVAESLQGFKKNIAIKRILPNLTKNKKFVAMFLDEARLSLTLQHANVVQVFDIGHADDTYFIVMEFVDGVDLKGIIEWRRKLGKRLPIAQTLYIMMEMCKGLSYAHDMVNPETGKPLGIVHRDISPPNVLISRQGEVKVVDFGLAKATSQIESTDPGVVKGKMSYLSPEAARGEEVDHRADIFAVGILLYELLTGKRLFYGDTDYQTVELVRNAKIPPIASQNPEVEPELEDVVRKALARRVDDRFQAATDLQDALAHYTYGRGLKVIARDIADMVRQCLEDRATQSGVAKKQAASLIDTLLTDEIVKFTSVDFEDPGAKPLTPTEMGVRDVAAPQPGASSDFIDPRAWMDDLSVPVQAGHREHPAARSQPFAPKASAAAATPAAKTATPKPAPSATAVPTSIADQATSARSTSRPLASTSKSPAIGEPTPGIEALARVLEPTPMSNVAVKNGPRRGMLIAMVVSVVVLGAVFAALAVKAAG